MAQVVTVNASVEWKAEPGAEPGRWIAYCEPLGLATEGESLDEIHSLIPETMHLLMIDLFLDNELEAFLRERGWDAQIVGGGPQEDAQINFPWHLVAAGEHDLKRATH